MSGYYNFVSTCNESESTIFSLSPVMPENEYKILLTWEDNLHNLDSCLTYSFNDGGSLFYVSGDLVGYYNSQTIAYLEKDTVGNCSEIMTVIKNTELLNSGEFRYLVYNKYADVPISDMNVVIKIYDGDTLISETIYAPMETTERIWYAFNITNEGISIKNEYYSKEEYEESYGQTIFW